MREIAASEITDTVARLCIDACHELPTDVVQAFHDAERSEVSPSAISTPSRSPNTGNPSSRRLE